MSVIVVVVIIIIIIISSIKHLACSFLYNIAQFILYSKKKKKIITCQLIEVSFCHWDMFNIPKLFFSSLRSFFCVWN